MAGTGDSAASASEIPVTTLEKVQLLKNRYRDSRRHVSRAGADVSEVCSLIIGAALARPFESKGRVAQSRWPAPKAMKRQLTP
jgi:hypothetical protein